METQLISNKQQFISKVLDSAINYKVYSEQMTHFLNITVHRDLTSRKALLNIRLSIINE